MRIYLSSKCLVALSVLTLGLPACGDSAKNTDAEGSPVGANGGPQGTSTGEDDRDGGKGGGKGGGIEIPTDKDAGKPVTMLGMGVVGKKCAQDDDCGGGGAKCAQDLTAGALGQLFGGSGPTRGYCTAECMTDTECGEGGLCFGYYPQFGSGECRKPCSTAADCGRDDNYECATITNPPLKVGNMEIPVPATCQPKQTPVSFTTEVGIACTADTSCNGGRCRTSENFPGGYCSGNCDANTDCGTDGVCLLNVYGSGGDCFEGCTTDTDCARDAEGYGCIDADGTKVCVAKADPLPDGIVGSPCADDTACGEGVCALAVGGEQAATPGGYCSSLDCVEDAQCGKGGTCIPTMGRTRCYKGCTKTSDCREAEGYTCAQRGDNKQLVCFPPIVP